MSAIPEAHQTLLEPYLSQEETPINYYVTETRSCIVTDQRFLMARRGERENRAVEQVDAISLDHLAGTTVEITGAETPATETIVAGGMLSVAGLTAFLFGLTQLTGDAGLVAISGGLIGAIVGIIVALTAFDTEEGHVELSLLTSHGATDRVYRFQPDGASFATSVSKASSASTRDVATGVADATHATSA